ncbi:plasma membrane G-protein coupled receptor [Paraphaeosphaeria sporulosa]
MEISMTKVGIRRLFNMCGLPYISACGSNLLLPFTISVLSASAAPNPSAQPLLSMHNGHDTTSPFSKRKTFNVWVAAAACAAVSMTASIIAFYWFSRMEKRFRHRLIMFLILGDAIRATWLFIFAVTSITRGTVPTQSSFCQASGFLVQYGTETSDYSVLVMAVHSAVHVIQPSNASRSEGLYPYRTYIYAGAFLFPGIMAGLAFINPHWGYMSQGAFCSLPLRPFWYRLALTWIPRYLIATMILSLAVAIYVYVGFEFRAASNLSASAKPLVATITSRLSAAEREEEIIREASDHHPLEMPFSLTKRRASSMVQNIVALRRGSQVASLAEATVSLPDALQHGPRSASVHFPTSPHDSEVLLSPIPVRSSVVQSKDCLSLQPGIETYPPPTNPGNGSPLSECPNITVHRRMLQERARIHKQLRLIFIYPLVYTLMWLIPFVNHCMTYQDRWVAHPLYWLGFMSTICVTLMGAVNCLIFTLRERPWRHIPFSDGTFFGSFATSRRLSTSLQGGVRRPADLFHRTDTEPNPHTPHMEVRNRWPGGSVFSGCLPSLTLPGAARSNRMGRRSDQEASVAMARARLESEKADRRRILENESHKRSVGRLETTENPLDGERHQDEKNSSELEQDMHSST